MVYNGRVIVGKVDIYIYIIIIIITLIIINRKNIEDGKAFDEWQEMPRTKVTAIR